MTRKMCALVFLLSASCDAPNASSATAATPGSAANSGAPGPKDEAPTTTPETPPTAAGGTAPLKFDGLSDCLQTCEAGDKIQTNRETCRLNCDAVYGAQAADADPGSADPVGKAATCFGRCYAINTATEDCANLCKTMASKATAPPAPDVLDRLGICIRTCHADPSVLPTNRATCDLNCTQTARVAGPAPSATQPATQ